MVINWGLGIPKNKPLGFLSRGTFRGGKTAQKKDAKAQLWAGKRRFEGG